MTEILNRIYADYLMRSRLNEYEALLVAANQAGYTQMSIRQFLNSKKKPRTLVHRHDIDSDLRTARKIFSIERKHSVKASYYFRLRTLDYEFMREIEEFGSEASYHYEEVSDFAKKQHIHDSVELRHHFPIIKNIL